MKLNTVIVTGATGFVGRHLVKRLLQNGVKVYAVGRNIEILNELKRYGDNVVLISLPFERYEEIQKFVDPKETIDVFFHFAWAGVHGKASDYELQLQNAIDSTKAVEIAVQMKVAKFVFAGSTNQIETVSLFLDNDCEAIRYTNIYGASKLSADMINKTIAVNHGIAYNSGMIALGYGKYNVSKVVPNVVMSQLMQGISPKLITGDCLYDLIYIDDTVSAFIAIAKKGINLKSYYIGNRKLRTFKELMIDIRDTINPDIELHFGEYPDELVMNYNNIDLEELHRDTGFECQCNFKETIRETAKWIDTLEEFKVKK